MSRDHRDQRGGHRSRKGRGYCRGCPWCAPITGKQLRAGRRAAIDQQLEQAQNSSVR